MKFAFSSHIFLFFIFIFCIPYQGNTQELPPILNYSPTTYNAANQNWAITQDDNNHIYAANNDGLLEYTGAEWNLYPSPDKTILRSVYALNDTVYSGSYMNFGRWVRSNTGIRIYESISDAFSEDITEDEQFWNILPYNKWILFQSLNRIYFYNTRNNDVSYIESENTIHKMYKINGTIYFHILGEGMYTIRNGSKKLVSDHQFLQDDVTAALFTENDQLIVVFQQKGIFKIQDDQLLPWKVNVNQKLAATSVYSGIQLRDKSIMLGTIANGVIQISENGNLVKEINQYKGLSDNTALSLFEDSGENVWIGLDNGIDCMNLNASVSNYIDQVGNLGTTYASQFYNGNLYLGTNQGLFYRASNTEEDFKLVENTEGQVWCLKIIDNSLFCGHNSGTYTIKEDKAILVSNAMGTWGIQTIPNHPELLLQGNYNGLNILEKINNTWKWRNKLTGFDISSRYFEQINDTHILVSHEYKGVYNLKNDASFTNIVDVKRDTSVIKGVGSSLTTFKGTIFYGNETGIYTFQKEKMRFLKNETLSEIYESDTYISGKLVSDFDKSMWGFTKNYIVQIREEPLDNSFQITKIPISQSLRSTKKSYENITMLKDDQYLLGTSNGYLLINTSKSTERDYVVAINWIKVGTSKDDKPLVSLKDDGDFLANQNHVSISYSVPEFGKYEEVEYQYKLEGQDDESWSNWSKNQTTTFENLRYGNYFFAVKARVNSQVIDKEVTYTFKINRPWYASNLAIIVYILALIGFFLIVNGIYKRYYRKQRLRIIERTKSMNTLKELEIQKELMQLKNENLQKDIEARNRELAVSTMSMIKKNSALNEFKEDLVKLEDSKEVKSIVKKINKSLNDKEDWKFFEEAFNHADKDFFKKVKELHPELTANDLRLCVYLRLNLSSKEIAPLLNISPRSVEIKRYRLRKKIGLDREVHLNNYFIDL